ncbi:hypothetical protein ACF1AE_25415 [Streptomyces sp. NPDC014986]|uniref:hypothetical protein n=1 Tax=Streptomyces sp. NPDC014986 TaxID=3364934 RepID=UPI0036FBA603
MDLTGSARATAAAAAAVLLGGLSVLLYGIAYSDAARAIGGGCLTIVAFMAASMILLHRWIVDTHDERQALAAAQRATAAERSRYFAAQAALENEQARLNRDMAEERRRIAAQQIAEREAIRQEFEEQKAILISETMEATVMMFRAGKFAPEAAPLQGNLIQFPKELPKQTLQRERSREHGVVGP